MITILVVIFAILWRIHAKDLTFDVSRLLESNGTDTIEENSHGNLLAADFIELIKNSNLRDNSTGWKKPIPRNLWIAFREIPPENKMYPHMIKMIAQARNDGWNVHLFQQDNEEEFMNTYFHNTSILWAYKLINSEAQAAASDIWRLCVLYAFGGLYIDDDAFIGSSLNSVIRDDEHAVLSREGLKYRECFRDNYFLSTNYLRQRYQITDDFVNATLFGDASLVQWAMIFAPQHPVVLQVLKNIVDIITKEYAHKSVLLPKLHQHMVVVCATGPQVLTATIRYLITTAHFSNITVKKDFDYFSGHSHIRIQGTNYEDYGGIYKVEGFVPYSKSPGKYKTFYFHMRNGHKIPLLNSYAT